MRRPPTRADLHAAVWAFRATASVGRQLAAGSLHLVHVASPPSLPRHAVRAVYRVLDARRATCLERALVLQAWFSAQGHPRHVVIGVSGSHHFAAHAWLEDDPHCHGEGFHEIHRLPAR